MIFNKNKIAPPIPVLSRLPMPAGDYLPVTPGGSPTLPQSGMDAWNPSFGSITPHASAPMLSKVTQMGWAGSAFMASGYQLTDNTEIHLYGQSDVGATAIGPCIRYDRPGQYGSWQLPTVLPARSGILAWPYDPTYGYGYPLRINSPEIFTVNCDLLGGNIGFVGDNVYLCGINLSNDKVSPESWVWLYKSGDPSGVWVTLDEVRNSMVRFTLPSLSTGTYQIWIHNGRLGSYGWHRARLDLIVDTPANQKVEFTTVVRNFKTYTDIHGGGPGTGVPMDTALAAAWASGSSSLGNTLIFEAGTYVSDNPPFLSISFGGGLLWKGQGSGVGGTKIIPGASSTWPSGALRKGSLSFAEDIQIDASSSTTMAQSLFYGTRTKNCVIKTNPAANNINSLRDCNVMINTYFDGNCYFSSGKQGNLFVGNNAAISYDGCEAAWFIWAHTNTSWIDNDVIDYDQPSGYSGHGRLLTQATFNVGCRGIAVINNTTHDLSTNVSNVGEQILCESAAALTVIKANGGTSNTVTIAGSEFSTQKLYSGTGLSSSNATNATPTISSASRPFSLCYNSTRLFIRITGGTNAILGDYPVVSAAELNTMVVTGAIGTTASVSGLTYEIWYNLYLTKGTDLVSSNATTATPTITSASSAFTSSDDKRIFYFDGTGDANIIAGVYKGTWNGSNLVLDRPCGLVNSISGGTWRKWYNHSQEGTSGNAYKTYFQVVGGKGVLQQSFPETCAGSGTNLVFTLDRPFYVPTDNTSVINITCGLADIVCDGNNLSSGPPNNHDAFTAASGFSMFNSGGNIYYINNTVTNTHYGVSVWSMANAVGGNTLDQGVVNFPVFWDFFANNTFSGQDYGIRIANGMVLDEGQEVSSNSLQSGNTFTNLVTAFFQGNFSSPSPDHVFVSGNTASFALNGTTPPKGIEKNGVSAVNAKVLFVGNSVSLGSGYFPGSTIFSGPGAFTISALSPALSSQFTGFQS